MEIRRKSINGHIYELVNEWGNCRDGFNHFTTILRDGIEQVEHKVHYINRTWERYEFETCMRGAVNELIDIALTYYIDRYKSENGIIRFKKGEKDKVIADFRQTDAYSELDTLKQVIEQRDFD